MALIDYGEYLDGDLWPSESKRAVVDETGAINPELIAVYDMPPQYAVAALHKLVRWAQDGEIEAMAADKAETEVRMSKLGRLLARKALSIEDFELYSEHGVTRNALSAQDLAYELATHMLMTTKNSLVKRLTPEEIGHLASGVATALQDDGLIVIKEEL